MRRGGGLVMLADDPDPVVGDLFAEMVRLDKSLWQRSLEACPEVADFMLGQLREQSGRVR